VPHFARISDLNDCSNQFYSHSQVVAAESLVLSTLEWKTAQVTSFEFIHAICQTGLLFDLECSTTDDTQVRIKDHLAKYVLIFSELSLQMIVLQWFKPSQIACAVIACSRAAVNLKPSWHATLKQRTGLSIKDFRDCLQYLKSYYTDNFR
jgi:hypothetical protein